MAVEKGSQKLSEERFRQEMIIALLSSELYDASAISRIVSALVRY